MIRGDQTDVSVSCRARLCESLLKSRRITRPPATRNTAINQIGMLINHAATAPSTTIAETAMSRAPAGDMKEGAGGCGGCLALI